MKLLGYLLLLVGSIYYICQQSHSISLFANTITLIVFLLICIVPFAVGFSIIFYPEEKLKNTLFITLEFFIYAFLLNAILLIYDGSKGIWFLESKEYFYCLTNSVNITPIDYKIAIYLILCILPFVIITQFPILQKAENKLIILEYFLVLIIICLIQFLLPYYQGIL
jgi:hypothetical protein